MLDRYFGLFEAGLFFALLIAFCVWQVGDVNREIARRKARERQDGTGET